MSELLRQMLDQWKSQHPQPPRRIVVTPLALLSLALKGRLPDNLDGVAVVCEDIAPEQVVGVGQGRSFGVCVRTGSQGPVLRSFDIAI